MKVKDLALAAKEAAGDLRLTPTAERKRALYCMADALVSAEDTILDANAADMKQALDLSAPMLDRLRLDKQRLYAMAEGIRSVADLQDPLGCADYAVTRPNGLRITRVRVPLGLIGVIYEARPNVTADAAALCIKSGNAVLLRGGSESVQSNAAIVCALRTGLSKTEIPADAVCFLEDVSHDAVLEMMRLTGVLDVLIPRGGAGLIRSVVENARVPVIETGAGVCHVYVDSEADIDMALNVLENAKCSRPSVCNACETLLVAREIAPVFLPIAAKRLRERGVELRGCPETLELLDSGAVPASADDWTAEYNDLILAIRIVGGLYQATAHIARYGTRHSETIVTRNMFTARRFCERVDAACVYVNASTRFTDGGEFGFGGEIGISTQKLHARGPMGLEQLTSVKYIVEGEGQIR